MAPKVPTSERGTAANGIKVAYRLRRKDEDDHHHQRNREHQLKFDVGDGGVDGGGQVGKRRDWMEAGRLISSCGRIALMALTTLMVLAPGCL